MTYLPNSSIVSTLRAPTRAVLSTCQLSRSLRHQSPSLRSSFPASVHSPCINSAAKGIPLSYRGVLDSSKSLLRSSRRPNRHFVRPKRPVTSMGAVMASRDPLQRTVRRQVWMGEKAGSIECLKLVKDELPAPLPKEIRVRVAAVGLNFADVFSCLGLYDACGKENFIPGLEFSGIVEEMGEGCSSVLKAGDRVMGFTRFGAYSTHLNVAEYLVRKLPDSWSLQEGAAFLVNSITVWYGMKSLGDLRKGTAVLVHSASGGCGLQALAICQKVGAIAVGTVGSPQKLELVLRRNPQMRSEQLLVRPTRQVAAEFDGQLAEALQAIGQEEGFGIVMDAVLGEMFAPGWARLRRGGRYIVYGAASMTPGGGLKGVSGVLEWVKLAWRWLWRPKLDLLSMPGENKGIFGFNLIWMFDRLDELEPLIDSMLALELDAPYVGHVFDFANLPDALRMFQSGRTQGKVVIEVMRSEDYET